MEYLLMRIIFALFISIALGSCSGGTRSLPGTPGAPNTVFAPIFPANGYRSLFSFNRTDGSEPFGGLTAVKQVLYGTTRDGGKNGDGVVFKITTSGKQTALYSFKNGSDGHGPVAPLIFVNGAFYGTTPYGGSTNSDGTVFKVTTSGKEAVVYRFKNTPDGAAPQASLTDMHGMLYGTTCSGGANNQGTVFRIATSGAEQVIYSFKGGSGDGQCPEAAVTDVNGTLYGTTSAGGSNSDGIVFKLETSGSEKVLHNFNGKDGGIPASALIAVKGTLYGTTEGGGAFDHGTVFRVSTSGAEKLVYSFKGNGDGADPLPAALVPVNGTLYGVTNLGGSRNGGTVFKITTAGKESVLYSFQGGTGDGSSPSGALSVVGAALFGATQSAGANSDGTVYSLTIK
jgi:uncharacterized repeat protein (TIGR03803 family)